MHSYLDGHPALIQAIKKLEQLNPDQFEIYLEKRSSTQFDSKNQHLDSLSREQDVGLSIRLIRDQQIGFSYTTSLENDAIERAVQSAYEIAHYMPVDSYNRLYAFGSAAYPDVDNFDPQGLKVSLREKIELAKSLEAACRATDRRITGVRSASLVETATETHLVDSNGEHIHHRSTVFTASITCKAEENGDSQIGSDYTFSNELAHLDTQSVAQTAASQAVELLGAGTAPTLKCPAVLRNSVVASLLDFLSASFSAEEIDKGRSLLAGKKGERAFSDQVTLIDDGLYPGGYGTTPFDAEGIPSRKTILVDGGFITGTLNNYYYSQKEGQEPTGSSLRGIKSAPSIGFSNLYMVPGRRTPHALYDGIPKGVLITDLMGLHTANPVTGDFSLGASGILIENGKLTRPVRGFAVAGNVLDLFRKMTETGNDLRFFGSVGAPSVRLSEISVGGQ